MTNPPWKANFLTLDSALVLQESSTEKVAAVNVSCLSCRHSGLWSSGAMSDILTRQARMGRSSSSLQDRIVPTSTVEMAVNTFQPGINILGSLQPTHETRRSREGLGAINV